MRARRATSAALCGLLVPTVSHAAPPPRPDQHCETRQPVRGYTGIRLAQSFTPTTSSVGRVDVLLGSIVKSKRVLPIRLVALRRLQNGVVAQTGVLAEGTVHANLSPFTPVWVPWRLPAPVPASAAGPLGDELAVQVDLPEGEDDVYWLNCDPYAEGTAYYEQDVLAGSGAPAEADLGVAQERDLGFREYRLVR